MAEGSPHLTATSYRVSFDIERVNMNNGRFPAIDKFGSRSKAEFNHGFAVPTSSSLAF
jgi:hypothetical protein